MGRQKTPVRMSENPMREKEPDRNNAMNGVYLLNFHCDYSALSLKRRFLILSVGISKETANLRKSRNANCSPIHPSCSTLIAWPRRAAKIFIHQNMQELKRVQRAARALRFSRAKRGCKGSRFAFLDLRRFAVSVVKTHRAE